MNIRDSQTEQWRDGVVECWEKNRFDLTRRPITPSLHDSITPNENGEAGDLAAKTFDPS